MPALGQRSKLRVVRQAPPGIYLDGESLGEILLPNRYIPAGTRPGDMLDVFVHRDSEDRIVATTEAPRACAGEFAFMRVVSVSSQIGAFLDWGLAKDLLLPIREQQRRVRVGESVVACVFLDPKSDRLVASTRLRKHLGHSASPYKPGQPVRLLIAEESPLAYAAIVENAHWGLLYKTDLGSPLSIGQTVGGYVREIRPDGKIDLSLDPGGYRRVEPLSVKIIEALKAAGGRLEMGDRSTPAEIRAAFGTSKKAFKQAIGALYRQRRIRIAENAIESVEPGRRSPRPG